MRKEDLEGKTREEITKLALNQRARPLEWKWVTISKKNLFKVKSHIKVEEVDEDHVRIYLQAGMCPCAECNHEYMWECNISDEFGRTVTCCDSTCT